jgi:pimeloyl-ACP methyl ester carboxylesterase
MSVMRNEAAVTLLTFESATGTLLDAALYEGPGIDAPRTPLVIHLHGKGGNFYTGPGRFIPLLTRDRDVAHLAINFDCHDLGYVTYYPHPVADGPDMRGGMWERIADGWQDVAGAVALARARGYRRLYLSGHSSGGFYAADYAARRDDVDGVILLSPVVTFQSFLRTWFPDPSALEATAQRARNMADTGVGHYLIPVCASYYGISARSLLERVSLPPDHLEQRLRSVTCPLLLLWGETESRHRLWGEIYERVAAPRARCVTIPGAGHHYTGAEQQVVDALVAFVSA